MEFASWKMARMLWTIMVIVFVGHVETLQRRGPHFVIEPPNRIDFLNSTGAVIPCTAQGSPSPTVSWVRPDGFAISEVPSLRQIRSDGSLVFLPFRAEDYRQDVHAAVYRCVASNVVGSIASRSVRVRAAVNQHYEVQVYDDFVITGNTAVLRCHIPSFVKEYVVVVSWIRDDGLVIRSNSQSGGRYSIFSTGELHIRHVDPKTDGKRLYFCQTRHRISGEVRRSVTSGQPIITEPHSNFSPRVSDKMAQVSTSQGSRTEIPCSAQGFPPPLYHWYKQDLGRLNPVEIGGRVQQIEGTLIFQKTFISDNGKYVCFVNNSVGEDRLDTELLVTAPLSAVITPKRHVSEEGESITFNCTIGGHPIRSVVWTKNRRPLLSNSRVHLLHKEQLHLSQVLREDKGMYQCFVQNDGESAQGTAELNLGDDPPLFSYTFTEQTLEPGPSLSLKCAATGNPLPQITWTLDGTAIADNLRVRVGDFVTSDGYVNSFVNITALRTEDGGRYECSAVNEVSSVVHAAKVNVFGSPFIRTIANLTVLGGSSLVLQCPVGGYPIEEIYWEKGTMRLPQSRRQTAHSNGTVIVEKVDRATDEGSYRCVAKNNQGEKSSRETFVRVLVAPAITPFSFPANLRKHMRSIVTCSVLEGDPPIKIRWLKDSDVIEENENVVIESSNEFSSTLFLKTVDYLNNGNYTCVATNNAASANYTATMVVNVPPEWQIAPTNKAVIMGQNVVIDCQASGFPHPRMWWEKSAGTAAREYRNIISNSHIHTLENGSLIIREAEESDEGFYLCQASNGVGTGLSQVIKLTVHVAAHFRSRFRTQTHRAGETVKLSCRAFGEKPIRFSWKKERQLLDTANQPRLQMTNSEHDEGSLSEIDIQVVDRKDSALFVCKAYNDYGEDENNIQLIVQEAPDVTQNILGTDINSRSITINWSPPYNGNSPIVSYKLEYKQDGEHWQNEGKVLSAPGTDTSAILRGLKPVTSYMVRVSAENAFGRGPHSSPVHITTSEEAPEGPPTAVNIIATSSNSVQITWQPPRKEHRNGDLKGYYIGYRLQGSGEPFVYKTIEVKEKFKEETILTGLRRASKYSVIIQAFNSKGSGPPSDEVFVDTLENDPPVTPSLEIASTTTHSIKLQWSPRSEESAPVGGYYIYVKKDAGNFEERQLAQHLTSYNFKNLHCGTHYEFYLVAYNNVGKGTSSGIVSAKTLGSVPIAPKLETFLDINSTSVLLRMNTWKENGCPIIYFMVQYKAKNHNDWILFSNHIPPQQTSVVLTDVRPGTWYVVMVTAHIDGTSTEAEYDFPTLTLDGAPPMSVKDKRSNDFHRALSIIVPSTCAIVVLGVIIIVACVVVKKRRRQDNQNGRDCRMRDEKGNEGLNMSIMDRKVGSPGNGSPNKEQLYYPSPYATSRIPGFSKHTNDGETSRSMRRTLARREHIYEVPYPPPKWEEDEDSYSHIMETSSVPLHPSCNNIYQTPRIMPPLPVKPGCDRRNPKSSHQRSPYRHCSLTSDGHSIEDSDNEEQTYMFRGHVIGSFSEPQELSEAECDRDFVLKGKKVYLPVLDERDFRHLRVT